MDLDGHFRTTSDDAAFLADHLKQGSLRFVWTDGSTDYRIYMMPSRVFDWDFPIQSEIARWKERGMVIVAIERVGCFHFRLFESGETFGEDYVHEKIGIPLDPAKDIADLLNMIRAFLSDSGQAQHGKNIIV